MFHISVQHICLLSVVTSGFNIYATSLIGFKLDIGVVSRLV